MVHKYFQRVTNRNASYFFPQKNQGEKSRMRLANRGLVSVQEAFAIHVVLTGASAAIEVFRGLIWILSVDGGAAVTAFARHWSQTVAD